MLNGLREERERERTRDSFRFSSQQHFIWSRWCLSMNECQSICAHCISLNAIFKTWNLAQRWWFFKTLSGVAPILRGAFYAELLSQFVCCLVGFKRDRTTWSTFSKPASLDNYLCSKPVINSKLQLSSQDETFIQTKWVDLILAQKIFENKKLIWNRFEVWYRSSSVLKWRSFLFYWILVEKKKANMRKLIFTKAQTIFNNNLTFSFCFVFFSNFF